MKNEPCSLKILEQQSISDPGIHFSPPSSSLWGHTWYGHTAVGK